MAWTLMYIVLREEWPMGEAIAEAIMSGGGVASNRRAEGEAGYEVIGGYSTETKDTWNNVLLTRDQLFI